jgi:hypothetical protein
VLLDRVHGGWLGRWHAAPETVERNIQTLLMIETHGLGFTPADTASAWLRMMPLLRGDAADTAAYTNFGEGLLPPHTADPRLADTDGAMLRADLYGLLAPGDPRRAARLARKDAAVTHSGEGLFAAMWTAALFSAAITAYDAEQAVGLSLRHLPPTSAVAGSVRDIIVDRVREAPMPTPRGLPGTALHTAGTLAVAFLWADDWKQSTELSAPACPGLAAALTGVRTGATPFPPAPAPIPTAFPDAGESRLIDLAARTCVLAAA